MPGAEQVPVMRRPWAMRRTLTTMCVGIAWMAAVCLEASRPGVEAGLQTRLPQASAVPSPQASMPVSSPARALVTKYCVTCHNERTKTANLLLDKADADRVESSADTWEKIAVQLRSRAMPPVNMPRPDNATYNAVATWLETELDRAAAARPNPGRPADLRRLNRTEYGNAVRDLLGVEIDPTSMLPPDAQAHGFDTNGDALGIEPALLDRYLTAAAKIARVAIGDPTMRPAVERYTAVKGNSNEQTWLWQTERLGESFSLGSRGGIAARHYFPVDGEYVVKVRLLRTYAGVIRGLNTPAAIEIRVDGARVGQFTVGGPAETQFDEADDRLQVRVPLKAGLRQVLATIAKSEDIKAEGLGPARVPIWNREGDVPSAELSISSLLIDGPYNGSVPVDSPSRQRIFVCQPADSNDQRPASAEASAASRRSSPETLESEGGCATRILSTLARRAYRRPATSDDVQTLIGFYQRARADGTFDTGIRAALERLLVSPDFLFRIEADPAGAAPGAAYRLSDVELASRLSFFLWSSIPDDELLDLAARGQLRDAGVLDRQVRRMLADPRARGALVDNFFGQWLQTRNVWLLTPDANTKFPWFDDNLRTAFVRETELFLDDQLKADRGIAELLTADSTFLNQQLARHYGVSGVYGSHFRRVALADENRWGLLGKASVLAVTSYPTRTSPTIRGKWLLENILAVPVPPPPPNANTNLDESKVGKATSVRAMLEQHRANPVCASCHARMDPIGFSLENFDAVGQWRTTDGDAAINATGILLDGTRVDGPAALRRALLAQKEQFVRTVTGKLLTYAIGREMEYSDAPAIRSIVRAAAPDDYRWSSVILAIVKSTPFQMRRSRS
jgi:mono/diheme cytochrome c family protein